MRQLLAQFVKLFRYFLPPFDADRFEKNFRDAVTWREY